MRLSADDVAQYYEGFSNATLWPLYHDVIVKPIYHREWWDRYVDVNRRFAEATARAAAHGATVWVQDYQLQLVPKMLRMLRPDLDHRLLPAHPVPAGGAVHADAVADRDRRRLARRRPRRLPPPRRRAELPDPVSASRRREHLTRHGRRALTLRRSAGRLPHREGRRLPDLHRLRPTSTARPATEASGSGPGEIRRELGNPRKILLGVDRLDYTKGIDVRLRAFSELLAEGRVKRDDTVLVQLATPSRERVESYKEMREDIERQVGHINGEYSEVGHPIVHYLHRPVPAKS